MKILEYLGLENIEVDKTTSSKNNAFCVLINNKKRTNKLLVKASKLGLTSPNNKVTVVEGCSYLTFFYDKEYDINIVPPADEKIIHQIGPVYIIEDLSDDYWTIVNFMQKASDTKKALCKKLKIRNKTLKQLIILDKQYKNIQNIDPFKKACDKLYKKNNDYPFIDIQSHYFQIEDTIIPINPHDNVVILR